MHPIKKAQTAVAKYWVHLWPRHRGYVNYDDFDGKPKSEYIVNPRTGMIGLNTTTSIYDELDDGCNNSIVDVSGYPVPFDDTERVHALLGTAADLYESPESAMDALVNYANQLAQKGEF